MGDPRSNPNAAIRPHYPGLDGLRAIAVCMVFLQHYGAGKGMFLYRWGWTGVDIFFVLSGFLITGILYDNRDQPFRYRNFFARRILRIFPLYYAVWLVILLATPWAQWRWDWHWSLWPAYLGNYARFLFLHLPGDPTRFDQLLCGPRITRHLGFPLHLYIGHFWSLCVEEQFYLVWPLLVYPIRRRETLIKLCIAVILAAPVLRWALLTFAPPQAIQLDLLQRITPTRIDALLIGALIALCLRGPEKELLHRWRHGFLAAAAALFLLTYQLGWTNILGFTFIDLFAAALILITVHPTSLTSRVLSTQPLRSLGTISYGFYVFHQIPHDYYSFLATRYLHHVPYSRSLLAFFSTSLIAWLSYRFFESPLLKLKSRFAHQTRKAAKVLEYSS